ncbi:hypothetical protein VNO77_05391 [Canavalia gladiata]|uniref:PPM-type phosphatase domain-containing protein n=1 Tax=Canavalia gladiata TaxID=3824 RepID=A0AAN9R8L8_CANGL
MSSVSRRRMREEEEEEVVVKEMRKNKRDHEIPVKPRDPRLPLTPYLPPWMTLSDMINGVRSNVTAAQLKAATYLRKIVSQGFRVPIDIIVRVGLVHRILEFLGRRDERQLQFEAAWILTNVASGTSQDTKLLVDLGAIPLFVQLLSSKTFDIVEQAVWALGNIAGDSPGYRDIVLDHGALKPLLSQLPSLSRLPSKRTTIVVDLELPMLRTAVWTLSNFCHGKPGVEFEKVKPALPVLQQLINLTDEQILTDACWALSYLSDGSILKIEAIVELGLCPRLVKLLGHRSEAIIVPAIRTLGNIVAGNDTLTQLVIDNQVLSRLYPLLTQNDSKIILKEACWIISNITAGNRTQKQAVIEANLILPLVNLLHSAKFDVKKEAAWAISNATFAGSHEQIRKLAKEGCIQPLCDLLTCPDPKIVVVCLEGLEKIMFVGEADKENHGVNIFSHMVYLCGGLRKIEVLQTHESIEVYQKCVSILERFWAENYQLGDLDDLLNSLKRNVPRVDGQLAMTQAFGDGKLKEYITAEPDVTTRKIDEDTEFIILASDDLWKVMTNREACDCIDKSGGLWLYKRCR